MASFVQVPKLCRIHVYANVSTVHLESVVFYRNGLIEVLGHLLANILQNPAVDVESLGHPVK